VVVLAAFAIAKLRLIKEITDVRRRRSCSVTTPST